MIELKLGSLVELRNLRGWPLCFFSSLLTSGLLSIPFSASRKERTYGDLDSLIEEVLPHPLSLMIAERYCFLFYIFSFLYFIRPYVYTHIHVYIHIDMSIYLTLSLYFVAQWKKTLMERQSKFQDIVKNVRHWDEIVVNTNEKVQRS